MPTQKRTNSALWLGLLLILLSVLSYFLYGLSIRAAVPWINLILGVLSLIFLFLGLKRAFGQSDVYGGKIWGSIVSGISVLLFAGLLFGHIHARDVPRPAGAPQVGQKVPDFTLSDSNGKQVSLAQLLSSPVGNSAQPKALLLIFYRGYW